MTPTYGWQSLMQLSKVKNTAHLINKNIRVAEILNERYINILPSDTDARRQYAPEVWDLLVNSYALVGGLIGKGFSSMEDMIENIPFWKMVRRDG
jgi:hypothetical protein